MDAERPILIYDGVCNFCNWWVDFILKRDKKGRFLFTANQEVAGKNILESFGVEMEGGPDSVFLYHKGKLYRYSSAAFKAAALLPFPWVMAAGFLILPKFLRDGIYKWVAKNRYKWFGKSESCRLPQPGEQERFLISYDDLAAAAPKFALKTV